MVPAPLSTGYVVYTWYSATGTEATVFYFNHDFRLAHFKT